MSLFKFHVGNQYEISKWENSHAKLNDKILKDKGFDSVFAKGGYDLKNNEFIVYDSSATTINYIVELKELGKDNKKVYYIFGDKKNELTQKILEATRFNTYWEALQKVETIKNWESVVTIKERV